VQVVTGLRLSLAARAVQVSVYEQNCPHRNTSLAKPLASSLLAHWRSWRLGRRDTIRFRDVLDVSVEHHRTRLLKLHQETLRSDTSPSGVFQRLPALSCDSRQALSSIGWKISRASAKTWGRHARAP